VDWFVGGDFRDNFVRISLGLAGMPARPGRPFPRHRNFSDAAQQTLKSLANDLPCLFAGIIIIHVSFDYEIKSTINKFETWVLIWEVSSK